MVSECVTKGDSETSIQGEEDDVYQQYYITIQATSLRRDNQNIALISEDIGTQ